MSNESTQMRTLLIFCVRPKPPVTCPRAPHTSSGRPMSAVPQRPDPAIPRSNRTTVSSTRSALNGCPINAEYDAIAMN